MGELTSSHWSKLNKELSGTPHVAIVSQFQKNGNQPIQRSQIKGSVANFQIKLNSLNLGIGFTMLSSDALSEEQKKLPDKERQPLINRQRYNFVLR